MSNLVNDPLAQALAERDAFLDAHPRMRTMQSEIDEMLMKAGPVENRMAVLGALMEFKLDELKGALVRLQDTVTELNMELLTQH